MKLYSMSIYEKPDSCVVCMEKTELKNFECGHWLHLECLQKQFKPECPLCRKVLPIKVKGSRPSSSIEHGLPNVIEETDFFRIRFIYTRNVVGNVIERGYEEENSDNGDISRWKEQGYTHRDEHPDYDEENPEGDDMDYPDEDDSDLNEIECY